MGTVYIVRIAESRTPSASVVYGQDATVQLDINFHGHRVTKRTMGKTTILGKFHQLANPLRRFI